MKKIKSLVIGLGKVGLHYDLPNFDTCLSHCNSLNIHRKFELVGGVDTNKTLEIFLRINLEKSHSKI